MDLTAIINNPAVIAYAKKELSKVHKNSFYDFFKFFWGEVEESDLIDNWHIKYLCDELQFAAERVFEKKQKLYDIVINIPPGSTKSRIVSIAFPVWCWVKAAWLRIIASSYSGDLAEEFALKARDILTCSNFRYMFPEIKIRKDKGGIKKYENTKGGVRYSVGFGGTATGKHADIIIIDDPLNPRDGNSEAHRKTANDVVNNVLLRRKTNKKVTLTIMVMQRLHEDDPTAHFLKRKNVKHICIPGRETDRINPPELRKFYINGLFDVVRLDDEALEEEKEAGSFAYNAQILQYPLDEENMIFNPEWWQYYTELPQMDRIIQSWDTAFDNKKKLKDDGNAFNVCHTWGVNKDGFFLIDEYRAKVSFNSLVTAVIDLSNDYKPDKIIIEDAASGKDVLSILHDLKNSVKEKGKQIPFKGITPVGDKVYRAYSVQAQIENGLVFLPQKAKWINKYVEELKSFPNGKFKDRVDTTSQGLRYLIPIYRKLSGKIVRRTRIPDQHSQTKYKGFR